MTLSGPKRVFLKVAGATLIALALVGTAYAHANLVRSDPGEGAVVREAPTRVQLWFSENLEPSFTKATVVDRDGKLVSIGDSRVASRDQKELVVPLGPLANGVYTVIWQALSAEDGHVTKGAFAFGVGDAASLGRPEVVAGAIAGQQSAPPNPFTVFSKLLTFIAPTALAGALVFQLVIVGPLFRLPEVKGIIEDVTRRRYRRLTKIAAVAMVAGVPFAAASQAMAASGRDFFGALDPAVLGALLTTRYGNLLVVRLVLAVIAGCATWWLVREDRSGRTLWLANAAVLVPTFGVLATSSLTSHASAVVDWVWIAVVADVLHLGAAAIWVGGVFQFAIAVGPFLSGVEPGRRTRVLGSLVPRFSCVALGSVLVIALTGLYAMWLHFPSSESLFATVYGQSLLVKLGFFLTMVVIGAVNLLFITPAIRRLVGRSGKGTLERGQSIVRRFALQVRAEAVIGVAVLAAVAFMVSNPPATSTSGGFYQEAQQALGVRITLKISPNDVGPNRYAATIEDSAGKPIFDIQRVVIRFQFLDRDLGVQEAILQPAQGSTWTGEGSQLSVLGNWGMRVIVRKADGSDTELKFSQRLGGPLVRAARGPFPTPADFGLSNGVYLPLAMILLGLSVGVLAYRNYRTDPRISPIFFTMGMAVALFGCYIVVFQTPRLAQATIPINTVAPNAVSIERGRAFFVESCAGCHGESGKGDGPLSRGLNPKPADLSQHVEFHPEGQIYLWIKKGVPGSAMPAWEGQYKDEEFWDIVNYLRSAFVSTDR